MCDRDSKLIGRPTSNLPASGNRHFRQPGPTGTPVPAEALQQIQQLAGVTSKGPFGRRKQAAGPLVFGGHRNWTVQQLSPDEIRRICHRREGCFKHRGRPWEQDNVLTISFTPTIYLNNELSPTEAANVQEHELGHYDDFLDLAEDLQDALTRHGISQWQDRWDWFLYDLCNASAVFHRRRGETDQIRTCQEPSNPRP